MPQGVALWRAETAAAKARRANEVAAAAEQRASSPGPGPSQLVDENEAASVPRSGAFPEADTGFAGTSSLHGGHLSTANSLPASTQQPGITTSGQALLPGTHLLGPLGIGPTSYGYEGAGPAQVQSVGGQVAAPCLASPYGPSPQQPRGSFARQSGEVRLHVGGEVKPQPQQQQQQQQSLLDALLGPDVVDEAARDITGPELATPQREEGQVELTGGFCLHKVPCR